MALDVSSINKNDLGALIAGGLVFVLSLMPAWVTSGVDGGAADILGAAAMDTGVNAWQGVNALAMLLLLLATAVVAVKVFAPQSLPSTLPVGIGVVAAGLAAAGTVILVIRTLTLFESQESMGVSFSISPGWSGWLLMIAAVALTVFAVLGLKESGESLPWQTAGSTGTGTHGTPRSTAAGTPGAASTTPTADPAAPPPADPTAGQQPPAPNQPPRPGDEDTRRRPPL
ncbi:MAG: hypothetical protein M3419_08090 [Actinomycetota bacterium]|nr:hypothetical protein [Actinomycetota bacterium]